MLKKLSVSLLILCLLLSGCAKSVDTETMETEKQDPNTTTMKFIIPDSEFWGWEVEERQIKDCTIEVVINELFKKHPKLFPEDLKLLGVEVKKGIAYLNMSSQFECFNLGEAGTEKEIFTIVNTLCLNESLNIKAVKFFIEGKEVGTVNGFEVDKPHGPNISLSECKQKKSE